jgi:hypothetical protein
VPRAEFEAFQAKYATLFQLARERGVHFKAMKNELDARSVKPAPELDREAFGATFYSRVALL